MQLSSSQKGALEFIEENSSPLLVCGAAGVGKSYLMAHYIETLLENGETVVISCPTNKAKGVMNTYLQHLKSENLIVNTISALLSLKRKFDESGNMTFVKKWKGNKPPSVKSLPEDLTIIIDEASMIPFYETVLLLSLPYRVIFTGDRYQLYPVNELGSKIFASNIKTFEITKTMRTNNKVLLTIFNSLRQQVARASNYNFDHAVSFAETYNKTKQKDKDAFYICSGPNKFRNKIEKLVEEKKRLMILCYTRNKAKSYNDVVRESIFGTVDEKYMEGERLVFDSYYDDGDHQRYTSDEIVVSKVNIEKTYSKYFGRSFKVYSLVTNSEDHNNVVYYKIHDDDLKVYKAAVAEKRNMNLSYSRKSKTTRDEMWESFNKATMKLNTPLVYNYAMTVHKSQGSTYENVLLDVEDCNYNGYTDKETFTRLVYTGATRASKSLTMLMSTNYFR